MIAHLGQAAKKDALKLSSSLRKSGISAVVGPTGRGLRSQLRYASSIDATHAVIIGDDELQKGVAILRDLSASEQQEVKPDELIALLSEKVVEVA